MAASAPDRPSCRIVAISTPLDCQFEPEGVSNIWPDFSSPKTKQRSGVRRTSGKDSARAASAFCWAGNADVVATAPTPTRKARRVGCAGRSAFGFFMIGEFRAASWHAREELKQARLAPGKFASEIFVGARGGHAATRSAVEHADLHQIRFVHFFNGVFFFAEGGGERAEAHRAPAIFVDQRDHQVAVDFVEAVLIDADHAQGILCDFFGYTAGGANFREVAC